MQVTLDYFKVDSSNKQNQIYRDKKGRQFWKVTIKYGETWASKLFYEEELIPNWKKGDTVDIEVKTSGDFVNWDFPKTKNPYDKPMYKPQSESKTDNNIVKFQNDLDIKPERTPMGLGQCLNLAALYSIYKACGGTDDLGTWLDTVETRAEIEDLQRRYEEWKNNK